MMAQRRFGQGPPPGDPATMVQRRVQSLTTLLGLTDAQASQATTIFTNAQTAATPIQTNLGDARQSMRDAVKSNDAAAIDKLAATTGTLTGQLLAVQSKADAAFYAILTADQQAKLNELGGSGMGPGMGPGGMGPMGPGRRGQ